MTPAEVVNPFNPLGGNPLMTRDDVRGAMEALLAPLRSCYSESGARVSIDASGAVFDRPAIELEGFARPLWGLASAAAGGSDHSDWWALYRMGLTNGTDPDHVDYWGDVGAIDQRMVELAAIAFALCVARAHLWDPLPDAARLRVAAYLLAARDKPFSDNNWKFFRVLIDLGLHSIGIAAGPGPVQSYLVEIDRFSLSDGWYRDGETAQLDHYVGIAFHFYGLLHAALGQDRDRAPVYRRRAAAFAKGYAHWFADDGAALPFGRSLIYRFAPAAFWGACAFAGVEALPWGVMKGLYLRHLRWWAAQPITRRDGLLTLGYAYPNSLIVEDYNSACSPYWAFKAFLPLALPGDHPFWSAPEQAPDAVRNMAILPAPGMIIKHEAWQTIALSSGQSNSNIRHGAEKYAKFAYSTRHAFCIETEWRRFENGAYDNMLALADTEGNWRVREAVEESGLKGDTLFSRWRPWPDVVIETELCWHGRWHIRRHRITSPRPLDTIEGGFALPRDAIRSREQGPQFAWAEWSEDFSGILDRSASRRQGRLHQCGPNANLLHASVAVPQLAGRIGYGETILITAVLAWRGGVDGFDAWAAAPDATAE